jgi:hypothetical protein
MLTVALRLLSTSTGTDGGSAFVRFTVTLLAGAVGS